MFPLKDENPTRTIPWVTVALVAVNLLVMVWLAMQAPPRQQLEVVRHGFIPARVAQLNDPRLIVDVPLAPTRGPAAVHLPAGFPQGQPAVRMTAEPVQFFSTILTCMFLHGGWLHVLGNMWFLWIFGNNVEDRLGHLLYVVFYLVGGMLATSCHWAYDPTSTVPVIGASGAVATVLGAYAVTWPAAKVRTLIILGFITIVDIPAVVWLGLWLIGQFVDAAFQADLGVAVWAHIGGFVAGALMMPILTFGAPPPGTDWHEENRRLFNPSPIERG
jgi:membrane associated rhomboid family serine protease